MIPAGPARSERGDGADRAPDRGAATVYINKRRSGRTAGAGSSAAFDWPYRRSRASIRDLLHEDRWDFEVFGVFRTAVLRRARLLDTYVASDRILRAHLGLLGRYHIVPEPLFLNRDHPDRSVRALPAHHLRLEWVDPSQASRRIFPHWKILREYVRLLRLCPLSVAQQHRCHVALLGWLVRDLNWARRGADLVIGIAPGSWRFLSRIARSLENWLSPHRTDGS